jgi:hypothetical protein
MFEVMTEGVLQRTHPPPDRLRRRPGNFGHGMPSEIFLAVLQKIRRRRPGYLTRERNLAQSRGAAERTEEEGGKKKL